MNDMIKAEREKILSGKPARLLFLMGLVLMAAYFYFFQFHYSYIYYNYNLGKMDTVSGFAAIEQRKAVAAEFEGELTQSTLARIQQRIAEAEAATAGQNENNVFSAVFVYRDQMAVLEQMTNPDGSLQSPDEASPDSRSLVLGYCDGWDKIISGMGNVLSVIMCLIIVIILSPVFAEEYSCHTDSVIYAARYGRTKLATAKIIASLETVTGIYGGYMILQVVLYGAVYGLQGGGVSIQASARYASSAYPLTFLQLFLLSVILNIAGILALSMITLFLSAVMHSPASALLLSCLVCFAPVFFDFTDMVPVLQSLQELFPVFMLHVNGVFMKADMLLGTWQPVIMLVFHLLLALMSGVLTKESIKRHQVTG